jgi:folate-binding protein YgfZ
MITDLRVFNDAGRTLLDVPASLAESLQHRMDALLFSEDARVTDVSASIQIVDVHGPQAADFVAGEPVVRDDVFELPGFSAFLDTRDAAPFIERVTARGAVQTTLETLDVVRLEAGRPAFLIDMNDQTIPLEAGLERRAISFTKGCYVGQEVVVRVLHRGGGRVAKKLVGLRLAPAAVLKGGEVIRNEGRDLGRITSGAYSPTLNLTVALGYVHRDFTDPGTHVTVATSAGDQPAEVSTLPFIPLALRLQSPGI